jgi:hypothetical protein
MFISITQHQSPLCIPWDIASMTPRDLPRAEFTSAYSPQLPVSASGANGFPLTCNKREVKMTARQTTTHIQFPTVTTNWYPTSLADGQTTWLATIYTQTFQTTAAVGPLGSEWSYNGSGTVAIDSGQVGVGQQQYGTNGGNKISMALSAILLGIALAFLLLG